MSSFEARRTDDSNISADEDLARATDAISSNETEPLAPGLDEDERFVDPVARTSRLEELERKIVRLSTLQELYQPWTEFDTIDVTQDVFERAYRNFTTLQDWRYCENSINMIVGSSLRPGVADLVPVEKDEMLQLLMSVRVRSSLSGTDIAEDHTIDDLEDEAPSNNPLNEPPLFPRYGFKREYLGFLDSHGLEAVTRQIRRRFPTRLQNRVAARIVAKVIDLAIVSFCGAHLERLDEKYLSKTLDEFPIFGNFSMRRRHLACLDTYLHGRPVWVFEAREGSSDSQTNRLYLSTTIEEFAQVWGPVWKNVLPQKPNKVITFSAGLGHIVPWPISPNGPPVLEDEVFCHWTNDESEMPNDEAFPDTSEYPSYRLLIGGIQLSENKTCPLPMDEYTFAMKCQNRLLPFGITREWKQRDSQTVSVSVGGLGLTSGYQEQYKIREGSSYKEDLLAAWVKQPTTRNPRFVKHWFGIEVSACTSNARRRRLQQVLGSSTLKNYLSSILLDWPDATFEQRYFDTLNSSDITAFENFYIRHKESREILGKAVAESLSALFKTGTDRNDCLTAMWAPDSEEVHSVLFPWSDFGWTGLLTDTADSFAVAIVSDKCLEFSAGHSIWDAICQCKRRNTHSLLETSLVMNDEAKMPPGLVKKPLKTASGSGDLSRWSTTHLQSGDKIDLGEAGHLKLVTRLQQVTDTYRHTGLIMEWVTPPSSRFPVKNETKKIIQDAVLKVPRSKSHWELVRNLPWRTQAIPIHVISHSDFPSSSEREI